MAEDILESVQAIVVSKKLLRHRCNSTMSCRCSNSSRTVGLPLGVSTMADEALGSGRENDLRQDEVHPERMGNEPL